MAFAISLTSARVGYGFSIIDSSICVAVITNFPCFRARSMIDFWINGTFSSAISTPRSPRATITPSLSSRMASRFVQASGFSIFAMICTCESASSRYNRSRSTSSRLRTNESATKSMPASSPKRRSAISFLLKEAALTSTPGRLIPLRSEILPPLTTSQMASVVSLVDHPKLDAAVGQQHLIAGLHILDEIFIGCGCSFARARQPAPS